MWIERPYFVRVSYVDSWEKWAPIIGDLSLPPKVEQFGLLLILTLGVGLKRKAPNGPESGPGLTGLRAI